MSEGPLDVVPYCEFLVGGVVTFLVLQLPKTLMRVLILAVSRETLVFLRLARNIPPFCKGPRQLFYLFKTEGAPFEGLPIRRVAEICAILRHIIKRNLRKPAPRVVAPVSCHLDWGDFALLERDTCIKVE